MTALGGLHRIGTQRPALATSFLVQEKLPPIASRIAPAHPLPGELAFLDNISTLHFRKSSLSSLEERVSKVFPDTSLVGEGSSLQALLSNDSSDLASAQDSLLGRKSQARQTLTGSGSTGLKAAQHASHTSHSDDAQLATGGSTIPAWTPSLEKAVTPSSFNKYSKVGGCPSAQYAAQYTLHISQDEQRQ